MATFTFNFDVLNPVESKGKIIPVLNEVSRHEVCGNGDATPRILNLGTRSK